MTSREKNSQTKKRKSSNQEKKLAIVRTSIIKQPHQQAAQIAEDAGTTFWQAR